MDIRRSLNSQSLAEDAARYIAERIRKVIAKKGSCHLSLAGGGTPKTTYELLRQQPIDWSRLHIWFGDERCLPVGDSERNDTMVRLALLNHIPLPDNHVHPIPAERGATAAAAAYTKELSDIAGLDIILLGMGEDGHTASLFPENVALELSEAAVPVFDAPKPPAERVSLSLNFIRRAEERIILLSGAGKREILSRIIGGERFPASEVGTATWFVDAAASPDCRDC
ncbi:6-phosphogluconolactonase [Mariprofundus ferrinatatus]|uniref:6-phosphogluconolactonase n=1 Tax=Mariprofundus ferrinatatus TaxID=1921087 RepID=A0A2K8L8N0_9PROT|nr:6-phosphogluconolactonase [Mariprofundus ferrinatatus]ATX81294.1 6-phosphogluconolactonase [Mariprofundus ferrinatatus]